MNFIIVLIVIILYLALIFITFSNMKFFDLKSKFIYLIIGIILNFIITLIIVNMAKIEIKNEEIYKYIKNIDILIFTAVNGIITIPTLAKNINNYKGKYIDKERLNRKIIFMICIFIVILIFEFNYLKGLRI